MKIYTKTGDKGETGLLGGRRVSKNCVEMQVIGEIDELNAALGIVLANLQEDKLKLFLKNIQRDLFKIGAELASLHTVLSPPARGGARGGGSIKKINSSRVSEMEKMIDEFWAQLPELQNFILPGGSAAGAYLHLARAVCRRAERQLVDLAKTASIRPELNIYLNRLSDFLFVAARWVNFKSGAEEIKV